MSAADPIETLSESGDFRERENAIRTALGIAELERETDLGNAHRFVRLHGDRVRYVHAFGLWFIWNGHRWEQDSTGEVMRLATDVPKLIYRQAGEAKQDDDRRKLARHGAASESERALRAMLALSRSLDPVAIDEHAFDANPWELNTRSCIVDLRDGSTQPNDPGGMCSKVTGCGYSEAAFSELWAECLETWFPDVALRDFVQRAVGYSLIGQTLEEVLFILWGPGQNGKTKFVEAIKGALGDYAMHTPAETLIATRNSGGVPNDLARLRGARFVTAAESDENRRLNEAKVKAMTGGDTITARFMRAEYFEFKPAFSVWLSTNHKPIVTGQDLGIWRRIKLIPFSQTIPDEKRDPKLSERLRGELPGILAWAVEGCVRYQLEGLAPPEAVTSATDEYRRESDAFGDFLEERTEFGDDRWASTDGLYAAYTAWCTESGEKVSSKGAFARKLPERGFRKKKSGGVRGWLGLSLR